MIEQIGPGIESGGWIWAICTSDGTAFGCALSSIDELMQGWIRERKLLMNGTRYAVIK